MRIADMFVKPVDRDIKGVIKVGQDDNDNIFQELDEYVVTNELAKHFYDFFASYRKGINGPTDNIGVWISGFFGSGKSHFLKILSYLLLNKKVNGKKAIDFFTEGEKLDDPAVIEDIKLAGSISTDVILFNIDSKSERTQSNKEPVLDVFMKVFNEQQGFCGDFPFLADLERKLTEDGQYHSFTEKFAEISGRVWEDTREKFYFIQDEVVQTLSVLGIMSEESARTWCDKAPETYSLSIGKFAELVRKYCEGKGSNHHVIFLVDEIGQYISGDTRLMLNLQTVTEDLGTACGGKAWVIVTSQQDIDAVVTVKGSDFSKIQGRFDTRLSLSSANVDEVIRKRILAKKKTALETLELLYEQKEAVIKNLLTFTGETGRKLYKNREEFAAVYPFIPYQFNLLGQVLTAIRTHGASGRHLADGERSMIALFKEAAMCYLDDREGILIPFHIFYNTLDQFIDPTHRFVIKQAEENSRLQTFDVELLKVLFMLKYVKEIKANAENLTSLMVSNIDEDRIKLRKQVEESLKRLTKHNLAQRNGEFYMFLTKEEQDFNQAINNESIELGEIINEVSGIIFKELIKESKYKYNSRYNFPYNQIVDDCYFKNIHSADIGVRIITPYSSDDYKPEMLRMLSVHENHVIVHLPNDPTFLEEIAEALKISKFITKQGKSLSETFEHIKRAKQGELIEKKERIRIYIEEALKNGDIYVNGDKAKIAAKEPASRINEALGKLVKTRYNKLSYMETAPDLSDLEAIYQSTGQMTQGNLEEKAVNKFALDDVLQAIELAAFKQAKVSLRSLIDRFSAVPFGFVELDVQWLVAMLFKQGKIVIKTYSINEINKINVNNDFNELNGVRDLEEINETDDIFRYLTMREYYDKLIIEIRERATGRQIKSVKEVMKDLFALPTVSDDEETLLKTFKKKAWGKLNDIEQFLVEYRLESRLPGEDVLRNAQKMLWKILDLNKPIELFRHIDLYKDDLLNLAEDVTPVITFLAGEQKSIFAKALKYIDIFNTGKTYIADKELISLAKSITAIAAKTAPYSEIYKLPSLLERFAELHNTLLQREAEPISNELVLDRQQVMDFLKQKAIPEELKEQFLKQFAELMDKLDSANNIAAVKNIRYESDALKIRCFNEIINYENQIKGSMAGPKVRKKIKTIGLKEIARDTSINHSIILAKEIDIDDFLQTLKLRLLEELTDSEDAVINVLL